MKEARALRTMLRRKALLHLRSSPAEVQFNFQIVSQGIQHPDQLWSHLSDQCEYQESQTSQVRDLRQASELVFL